ncbi:MAG TPA: hypothetical protein VM261_01685 [Kofleriaceae bacterium]|nr:hypothetical protein [Kofleriaceae bacterium]
MRLPAFFRLFGTSFTASLLLTAACGGGGTVGGDDDGDDDDDVPGIDAGDTDIDSRPPDTDGGGGDTDGGMPDVDAPPSPVVLSVCASGGDYPTLGAAVAAAPAGATLEICAGTYSDRLGINKSLTLRGAGSATTILDAAQGGSAIELTGATLTITGLTIQRGRSATQGGGIKCTNATLAISASALLDNRAEAGGGGIGGSGCTVAIDGVRFDTNEGRDFGGGIYLVNSTGTIASSQFNANSADYGGGVNLMDGDVDISASQFTTNRARVRGGGLYQNSDSTVSNSTFDRNTSGWTGGAVHVNQHAPTFTASQFTNNSTAWEGGAFYIHQGGSLLTDNTISSNVSIDDGGGLRMFETRSRLERNMITNNRASEADGGGLKSSHLPSTFIDNMIIDNWAEGAGGGMELDNDASQVRGGVISGNHASIGGGIHTMLWPYNNGVIEDVRIVGNDAHRGGGIYMENSWTFNTLRRLIISGNDANYGGGVYTRGTPLRMSNSSVYGNVGEVNGGGFYVHSSYHYPWTKECPCPPIDPAADVSFVVIDGNTGGSGTGMWINAPNITFRNSIITGTGTVVHVAEHTVPPPPMSPPGTPSTIVQTPPPGYMYNNTYPATFFGMSDPTGSSGNITSNPRFVNADMGDFHLASGSASIDAAEPAMTDLDGSRADQGFYGGPGAPATGN